MSKRRHRVKALFYFIFTIIVLILFLITRNDKRGTDKYLITALSFFMLDIVALILYFSKDAYYYNVLNQYFSFPESVWNILIFSNFPQSLSIRLMNVATLLFIYFSLMFTMTFITDMRLYHDHRARNLLLLYLALQGVLYDPWVSERLYYLFCGTVFSAGQVHRIAGIIEIVTRAGNVILIAGSIVLIFIANRKVSSSNFFRIYALGESVCYASVEVAYLFVFWFAPTFLVKISKLAGYLNYQQIPLTEQGHSMYRIFPYYLTAAGIAILYFIVMDLRLQRKIDDNRLYISRQIDAADTTSKAFCHYIKNELLAIQSEIDMLEVSDENAETKQQILKECSNLYDRLDEIHRSTKMSRLTLVRTDLRTLMGSILEHMKPQLKDCRVVTSFRDSIPDVMVDPVFFEQAIQNIIVNALDAMQKESDRESVLTVQIEAVNNWVQLSVSDNGTGIPGKDLNKIFAPFVSSQPIKQHWGIGLTVTYKIIAVHGGKIEVVSQEHQGTTFKILLPSILTTGQSVNKVVEM